MKLHSETQSSELNWGPRSEMSDGAPNRAIQAQMNTRGMLADLIEDIGMTSGHQVVLSTIETEVSDGEVEAEQLAIKGAVLPFFGAELTAEKGKRLPGADSIV
ncbi:hypothetical protein AAFF_G00343370 [Aldrovandia affinis]|uniref:Uncharacterized protein n=1 Tax=Aldrovandia affinis TaxID=143900 RepID=A0AAD7SL10_9TELE|nr:hypothetical protein AAFF_G00343370 [Aldrovandia affinis]